MSVKSAASDTNPWASQRRRWGRTKLMEIFGADLRSLAALRMVLAVTVLADLSLRADNLVAHYSDIGVLPRGTLIQTELDPWQVSLNVISGEPLFQAFLFGVTALAALGMLVGYRTRLMTIIVWVMVLSIQYRNPWVLSGADNLLRVLLFWAMFLPLGAYWSVDRALKATPWPMSVRFLSVGTVGLFLQIAFMYWFTAAEKSGSEWRVDGTALYYALNNDHFVTPIGVYVRQFPALLEVLTFATLALEAFGPFLLFCPVLTRLVRTGTVLSFVGLHFGILLTMYLGLFNVLGALCMVCFLPSWFWDEVVPKIRPAFPQRLDILRRPIQAYWLPFRRRLFDLGSAEYPSLASVAASASDSPPDSHAALTSSTPPTAMAPPGTGDEPMMLRASFTTNVLAAFFVLFVFSWNLTNVSEYEVPESLRPMGDLLGLWQSWEMFAPSPSAYSTIWYVIPGTLRDGREVDLFASTISGEPSLVKEVSWGKPQNISGTLDKYWRKYMEHLTDDSAYHNRLLFASYICRDWNTLHKGGSELTTVRIAHMTERTLPDYLRARPQREWLLSYRCQAAG